MSSGKTERRISRRRVWEWACLDTAIDVACVTLLMMVDGIAVTQVLVESQLKLAHSK